MLNSGGTSGPGQRRTSSSHCGASSGSTRRGELLYCGYDGVDMSTGEDTAVVSDAAALRAGGRAEPDTRDSTRFSAAAEAAVIKSHTTQRVKRKTPHHLHATGGNVILSVAGGWGHMAPTCSEGGRVNGLCGLAEHGRLDGLVVYSPVVINARALRQHNTHRHTSHKPSHAAWLARRADETCSKAAA